jgi:hypothetical protein
MNEMKILVGDVVKISPRKMATIDDLDLENCTVLELKESSQNSFVKVILNNNDKEDPRFFNNSTLVDWFAIDYVVNVERDYTIINIADHYDTVSHQPVSVVTMIPVIKKVKQTYNGHNLINIDKEQNAATETFAFLGVGSGDMEEYLHTVNRINFSNFKSVEVDMDGTKKRVWYAKPNLFANGTIFSIYNVA